MSRNKFPEETVQKILEVAQQLFLSKGYEATTIQDIVDALGMSKGAIYHHFKSKEDIYDHITDLYYDQQEWMRDPLSFPGETALEKMQGLFCFLLSDPDKLRLDRMSAAMTANPKLVLLALESTIRDAAPCVELLIRAGNEDGSIHVRQPKETAEGLMVLLNMWMGVFAVSRDDFMSKLSFLKDLTDSLGLPLLNDKVVSVAQTYFQSVMSQAD